ncbi:DUF1150 family protein [Devosia sp. J2-20]|mgnify:CR=1 FL=1|jgi:hypothetical protein|uniref:DUF1150 family protein n=1 Tax=Devosia TaxID=46913 RepID=UPI0022AE5F5A|nr:MULTISPECIES: DUF1150 family protein [Devosia]MCZ4347726.1 DUF1150 family protein [Devosia neptuniae]WDR00335.1 DUF1150 family protein [Devosia sp. J2-20]|tara:strand:+ start:673 stop:960 length:288 start_codon:yes stop_codon:yes gene_type:complete
MYEKRNDEAVADHVIHPLKDLTRAQFAALGGDAVAYLRPVTGAVLGTLITDAEFEASAEYQLLMSADGTPLLVTDTADAVSEWLGETNLGLATLH